MAIKLGHASIDENGHIQGGKEGDQTGREVCTRSYYMHSKGWYLLRPKSVKVANAIANAMLGACNNNHIGYDQNYRLGVITKLKSYKTLANIKVKTESDCSSLVRACCIEAGFDPGNFTTANEASALENSGYFEKRVAVTSKTELHNGDVLVTKTKGHTVVVVSGNPRKEDSGISILEFQKSAIADGFKFPKYGSDGEWGTECKSVAKKAIVKKRSTYSYKNLTKLVQRAVGVTVDGECGPNTDKAIREYQAKHGLTVDGCVGLDTWRVILGV